MKTPQQPEILLPRTGRAGAWFDDENIDMMAHVLDDCFRIPGTSFRFGLYGVVGLVPGIGDMLGGIASCLIVVAAWFRGVAYITLARMVVNVALEVVLGGIPLLGDLFDIVWKANRRNYDLLKRTLAEPRRHLWRDWLFLAGLVVLLVALLLTPLLLIAWLLGHLLGSLSSAIHPHR